MRLRAWNDKPAPKFYKNGGREEPYYLGVELEVEAPNGRLHREGLALRKRPHCFYAKNDGSLVCGWEIVTHPIGKSLWLERNPAKGPVRQFLDLVTGLKRLGYSSHDSGRCGFHIHVCRKLFGGYSNGHSNHTNVYGDCTLRHNNHYYWFSRLVNGELFLKLSQRCEGLRGSTDGVVRFARQLRTEDFYKLVPITNSHDRYKALNVTKNTVEVRLPRGNMREDRIRKNVESVIAGIEFSMGLADIPADNKDDGPQSPVRLDNSFIKYVKNRSYIYPNLYRYLNDLLSQKGTLCV